MPFSMKISNRLRRYLLHLPILGLVYFMGTVLLAFLLFTSREFWSIYYLPVKLVGEVLGIFVVARLARGGNVNYYFVPHTPNEDEKKLDSLILKYGSNTLIVIAGVLFIAIDIILSFSNHNPSNKFTIGSSFGIFLWTIITVGLMCEGVKFLSAWWNIKRNWKKEFAT
jgi:hypothetical protein